MCWRPLAGSALSAACGACFRGPGAPEARPCSWVLASGVAPLCLCCAWHTGRPSPEPRAPQTCHSALARLHPFAGWVAVAHPCEACLPPPKSAEHWGRPCFPPGSLSPLAAVFPRAWPNQPAHSSSPFTCFFLCHPDPAPSAWPQCLVLQCYPYMGWMGYLPA